MANIVVLLGTLICAVILTGASDIDDRSREKRDSYRPQRTIGETDTDYYEFLVNKYRVTQTEDENSGPPSRSPVQVPERTITFTEQDNDYDGDYDEGSEEGEEGLLGPSNGGRVATPENRGILTEEEINEIFEALEKRIPVTPERKSVFYCLRRILNWQSRWRFFLLRVFRMITSKFNRAEYEEVRQLANEFETEVKPFYLKATETRGMSLYDGLVHHAVKIWATSPAEIVRQTKYAQKLGDNRAVQDEIHMLKFLDITIDMEIDELRDAAGVRTVVKGSPFSR